MKNLENDIDLIEKFLEGSLSENEETAFQERLANDTGFADAFAKRKLLQKAFIEAAVRADIKKTIGSVIAGEKHKAQNHRLIWLAAATLIILATVGSLLIYNTFNRMPEDQFATEQNLPEIEDREAKQRKSNSMEEYGNLDVLVRKELVDDFFPDELTVLNANDTIIFKWPSSLNERYLTIYNRKGELVKKEKIKKKVKEFIILPGTLKPAVYFWKFMNDSTLIRITVSNQ